MMDGAAFSSSADAGREPFSRSRARSLRLGAVAASLATVVMLAVSGCDAGGGATAPPPTATQPVPPASPTPTSPGVLPTGTPTGGPSELDTFRARCEQGIQEWKVSAGQADYPKSLVLRVGQPSTYNAAIDISAAPVPPDDVITVPSGVAASEPIYVKCAVAARLVPVGEVTVEPGSDEWVTRTFSPAGVAEWAWTVSTTTSSPKELRLQLQPAALGNGVPLAGGDQTAELLTRVSVDATAIDSASDWMTTQWPKLVGIVAALGLAAMGLLRWKGWPMLFRSKGAGGDGAAQGSEESARPQGGDGTVVSGKRGPAAKAARDRSGGAGPGRKRSAPRKPDKRS